MSRWLKLEEMSKDVSFVDLQSDYMKLNPALEEVMKDIELYAVLTSIFEQPTCRENEHKSGLIH